MSNARLVILITLILALGALCVSGLRVVAPLIIYNSSDSMPRGFYSVSKIPARRGDIVLIRLPKAVAEFAAQRRYLPSHIPLLKRLSGKEKDWVCQIGDTFRINGVLIAPIRTEDRLGRDLPVWRGCLRLAKHQIFVFGDHPASFDSRVFGPLNGESILGVARPLWINKKGHGPLAAMSEP